MGGASSSTAHSGGAVSKAVSRMTLSTEGLLREEREAELRRRILDHRKKDFATHLSMGLSLQTPSEEGNKTAKPRCFLSFRMRSGAGDRYVIRILLSLASTSSDGSLNQPVGRTELDCARLVCEHCLALGESVSADRMKAWQAVMEREKACVSRCELEGADVRDGDGHATLVLTLFPKPAVAFAGAPAAAAGSSPTLDAVEFYQNDNGYTYVSYTSSADASQTFFIMIDTNEVAMDNHGSSLSLLQVRCVKDVLLLARIGDRFSEDIFKQHLAGLKLKYPVLFTLEHSTGEDSRDLGGKIVPTSQSADYLKLEEVQEHDFWLPEYVPEDYAAGASSEKSGGDTGGTADDQWQDLKKPRKLPTYGKGEVRAEEFITASTQAEIYKGTMDLEKGKEREVAIKVFSSADWKECQVEILGLQRAGGHENVMEIFSFYQVADGDSGHDRPCVVMRFIDGGDLRNRLDKLGAMSHDQIVFLTEGIVKGLQHLHRHDLVHRDVKSPNVMLDSSRGDMPVLIDMGLAHSVRDAKELQKSESGGGGGTAKWKAPELFTKTSFSAASDIFAVGIMIWEMLTGEIPYKGMNEWANIRKVATEGLRPDPDLLPEHASPALVDLMRECWDAGSEYRPTAEQILTRLASMERDIPPSLPSSKPPAAGSLFSSAANSRTASVSEHVDAADSDDDEEPPPPPSSAPPGEKPYSS